ncbi:DUF1835 domain-containing protein [Neptuniibacter halophilus]|uniref:DUF1835 domain-containing protein n=1 Tax=Neptuniibacter halophilus TaxID=651666 RepID=UPI00257304EC|nr:DUF1835 domain-containing protein [Neptuniibacter halophilus]
MQLHITNGDCTAELLRQIDSLQGEVLCWRDLLHDGPLLKDPVLYREARVEFITSMLLQTGLESNPGPEIEADFRTREQRFNEIPSCSEVVLWFEHDLYDQLQLVEICQRLKELRAVLPKISLICIDQHPEVPFFHGLGNLTPAMLEALYPQRRELNAAQLRNAQNIWQALIAEVPQPLADLAQSEVEGWPFMSKALRRFCCEFPAAQTGLTLTQTYLLLTLLKAPDELPVLEQHLKRQDLLGHLPEGVGATQRYYEILTGPARFSRIFHHLQQLEVDPFMGDLSIRLELQRLAQAEVPYISVTGEGADAIYSLTAAGAEALQGRRHWQEGNAFDLWRGGVHICPGNLWFWDPGDGQFVLYC